MPGLGVNTPLDDRPGASLRSWLPQGLELLSCFPEAKRRRTLVVALQVFVDESESQRGNRVFVMAGAMSTAERWAAFSEEWQRCLDAAPILEVFKGRDALGNPSASGGLRRWSHREGDGKLRELVAIMGRHIRAVVFCVLDLEPHAKHFGSWPLS
jgi:hypothetical protein